MVDITRVRSFDGTTIACWRRGSGPPLVMVHGTTGDHDSFRLLAPLLAGRFTVYAVDRRGRGESGDAETYAFEREGEDIAAVVDSVDEPAHVFGHSFGANVALEAALVASNLRRLVLYEPAVGEGARHAADIEAMQEMIDAGDREGALEFVARKVVELTPDELEQFRRSPVWTARVAAVHTVPRELRAESTFDADPARFSNLAVPTLFLLGSESPEWARRATRAFMSAVPEARVVELDGQGHVATMTAPDALATEISRFLAE